MLKTVEAVREREREREHNFNKLSFISDALNTVLEGIKIVEKLKINRVKIKIRMDYVAIN